VGTSGSIELSALNGTDGFVLNGINASDFSGRALAAGDLNSDGIDEVLVGAYGVDANGTESGASYLFFNGHAQTIDGDEGYRTLGAPISGAVFDELLGNFWTQGFANSDGNPGDDDNVWVWNENLNTNDQFAGGSANVGDWDPLTDQSTDNLAAGQGFLFYVFSDDDFDGSPEGFPKQISRVQFGGGGGTLNSGSVTPISNLGDGRFFLAGNPYVWTVDWDRMSKTNLSGTVYVYDDATSSWPSWNGASGTLTDGLIAPFQGFFIQASGGTGSLTIEEADTVTTEGTFYKQIAPEPLILRLDLEAEGYSNPAFLQFDERALAGRDRYDGLELQPLSGDYLQLFTEGEDDIALNINALPLDLEGTVEIPLQMQQVENWTSVDRHATLRWSGLEQFPYGWRFLLVDTQTGREIDLAAVPEQSVSITAAAKSMKTLDRDNEQNPRYPQPVVQSADGDARYVLKVTAGEAAGPSELPAAVDLRQNYPNPFNPSTVIRFELPETQNVTLEVFDLSGRKVATLLDGPRNAGRHQIQWAPDNLASGLYLYKLRTGNRVITKKMMLIK